MAEVLPTIRLSFAEQGGPCSSVVLMQTALWGSLSQGINFCFQRFEESRCHLFYRHVRTNRHEEVGQVGSRVQAWPQRPQQWPPDAADLGNVAGDMGTHHFSPRCGNQRAGLFTQVVFHTTFSCAGVCENVRAGLALHLLTVWARQTWSEARDALTVLLGRNGLLVSASSCSHSACRKHQILLRLRGFPGGASGKEP